MAFDALDFLVLVAPPRTCSAGALLAAVAPPRTARAVADRRGARIAVAAVATRMHHANRRRGAIVLPSGVRRRCSYALHAPACNLEQQRSNAAKEMS